MTNIAIVGSGPTGLYTLKRLVESKIPISITVYEAQPDPGRGTPYHPWANDRAKRCGMTLVAQPGIVEEPDVLRAIVRKNRRYLGIYCDVIEPGNVSAGDEAHLVIKID